MLTCEKVSFAREHSLFEGVGFCLRPATALGLRGKNGSGKTTLLRLLAGLHTPTEGEVSWLGEPVKDNSDYQSMMCYVGHQNAHKADLSVYDNLQYFAALKGTEMLVPAALQFFGLLPYMDMPVSQLSAGWQRRVALARLVAIPAIVWLLDEPTANLDDEGCRLLDGLIGTRLQQGGIVIVSGHQQLPQTVTQTLDLGDFIPAKERLSNAG